LDRGRQGLAFLADQEDEHLGWAEEWAPYIFLLGREDSTAHLDSLKPQALGARTFETLLQMQLRASHQRPLLLEVETVRDVLVLQVAGLILSAHNTEGARSEDASRIAQLSAGRMTIRNNAIGIIAANGSDIRVTTEAAITDNDTDIVLIFGSRAIFTGTTLDTTICDKISLLRIDNVDVTCPTL
jgi:hypothetical protein